MLNYSLVVRTRNDLFQFVYYADNVKCSLINVLFKSLEPSQIYEEIDDQNRDSIWEMPREPPPPPPRSDQNLPPLPQRIQQSTPLNFLPPPVPARSGPPPPLPARPR